MFVQAGGYLGDLVFLHDAATYTWRSSFRMFGYLGDSMLLHEVQNICLELIVQAGGCLGDLPSFCSGRRMATMAIRGKIRPIPSHQNQENFRTSLTQRRAKGFLNFVQDRCEALFLPSLLPGSWHEIRGDVRSGWPAGPLVQLDQRT